MNGRRAKLIRKAVLQHPNIVEMGPNAFKLNMNRYKQTRTDNKNKEAPAFTSPFRQLCRQFKKQWLKRIK